MLFTVTTMVLALGIAAFVARALLRGRTGVVHPAQYDLRVYRDQLREVDRDVARGVVGADEAARLRTEVSRRILAADAALQRDGQGAGAGPVGPTRIAAGIIVLAIVASAALLYGRYGAAGYRDLPLSARIAASEATLANLPTQGELEARMPAAELPRDGAEEHLALMDRLRATLAENPDDLRGFVLLARNEAQLGNNRAAYAAQQRVLDLKGDEATAIDHVFLADLMITAAGGAISAEAQSALRAALERDPGQKTARYYLGLLYMQVERPDAAFRIWEALLRDSPPDAPWVATLRARLPDVASLAGVRYTLPDAPEALPGPDAEAVDAAQGMSAEDRQAFIRSMVDQLSDRLATEGGTPPEWARLITALGVLGEMDQARAIRDEALTRFADNEAALAAIRAASAQAGLEP